MYEEQPPGFWNSPLSVLIGTLIGVFLVCAISATRLVVPSDFQSPFILLTGAIAAAAWIGGWIPGSITTAFGVWVTYAIFLPHGGPVERVERVITEIFSATFTAILIIYLAQRRLTAIRVIEESNHRFFLLTNTLAEGLLVLDAANVIQYANKAAHEMFHWHGRSLTGIAFDQLIDPAYGERYREYAEDAHDQTPELRFPGRTLDGDTVDLTIVLASYSLKDVPYRSAIIHKSVPRTPPHLSASAPRQTNRTEAG